MTDRSLEILLVEDNPRDEELTLHSLRRHNVTNKIHVVRDGQEALDYLFGGETSTPRVILLDLKLPKVDGLDVLRRVKGDDRTRDIPVVVLTSSREERDLAEAYKLGVNSYVVKPVNFERFADAVRQLGLYWLLLNEAPTSVK